jgi:transcriptional regulator with XRE-family HTH domain
MAKLTTVIDRQVGMRVLRARLFRGITQEELACALRISLLRLQKYESGFERIDARRLLTICEVLQVQASFFFVDLLIKENVAEPVAEPTENHNVIPFGKPENSGERKVSDARSDI